MKPSRILLWYSCVWCCIMCCMQRYCGANTLHATRLFCRR